MKQRVPIARAQQHFVRYCFALTVLMNMIKVDSKQMINVNTKMNSLLNTFEIIALVIIAIQNIYVAVHVLNCIY